MRGNRVRTFRGATVLPAAPPKSVVRHTLNIYSHHIYIKLSCHRPASAGVPTRFGVGASE